MSVEISFSKTEASIFRLLTPYDWRETSKILTKHDDGVTMLSHKTSKTAKQKLLDEKSLGPFSPGLCTYVERKT